MADRAHAVRVATAEAVRLVGRIREAWPWLAEAAVPGPTAYVERELSAAARARLDRLVGEERAERAVVARRHRDALPTRWAELAALAVVPGGPVRIAPLDARASVLSTLDDVAWRLSSSLRGRDGLAYRRWGHTAGQRATAALDYLAVMLHHVTEPRTAEDAVRALDAADRLARSAAGAGADRRMVKGECPACGGRSLRADVGSPNYREWAILCVREGCRCRGIGCGCRRPDRYPGARHIWPEREWHRLAGLLEANRDPR